MEKEKSTDTQQTDKIAEREGELRVYEASYLLLPFIGEEDTPKEAGRVKESILLAGGMVFSEEEPKLIKLAYPMVKTVSNKNTRFESAYFGWVKFEGEPASMEKIKKDLENNENILRFLLLKTTKDTTTAKPFPFTVKPKPISTPVAKEEVKSEAPKEINEEELDKTIDDLVIE
ncbi:MAG: 30S ribosomal protein S6 [Parcubacteria group bacterium]|nr:30S ribosomal protein S6 [Parcubacteria group bacterium]